MRGFESLYLHSLSFYYEMIIKVGNAAEPQKYVVLRRFFNWLGKIVVHKIITIITLLKGYAQ